LNDISINLKEALHKITSKHAGEVIGK
jgi:hypothetical protein